VRDDQNIGVDEPERLPPAGVDDELTERVAARHFADAFETDELDPAHNS